MEGLTEGRVVHLVLPDGAHVPAEVVLVHNRKSGMVNLMATADSEARIAEFGGTHKFFGSVVYDGEGSRAVRTWHWVERA